MQRSWFLQCSCNPWILRDLSQPKFGQQNKDGASRDAWRHYDSRELFVAVFQVFPERPVNIGTIGPVSPSKSQFAETMWRHSLLMPPGKKTKNTLAYVFTVANVLETWERYHRPLLIYRCYDFFALPFLWWNAFFLHFCPTPNSNRPCSSGLL